MHNTPAPLSSFHGSLNYTYETTNVAGAIVSGGELTHIHHSGPHQGDASDDGPSMEIIGRHTMITEGTFENCRSGILHRAGQLRGTATIRSPKETTVDSYQFKSLAAAEFPDMRLKVERNPSNSNAANANSDFKSVQLLGKRSNVKLMWSNAANPNTSQLYEGDALVVEGDDHVVDFVIGGAKGAAVTTEAAANNCNLKGTVSDSGTALVKNATGPNHYNIVARNVDLGIDSQAIGNGEQIDATIQINSGGAYVSGSTPSYSGSPAAVAPNAKWNVLGLTHTGATGAVTKLRARMNVTIAASAKTHLASMTLPRTLMWTPDPADISFSVKDDSVQAVSAKVYGVPTTTSISFRVNRVSDDYSSELTVAVTVDVDLARS